MLVNLLIYHTAFDYVILILSELIRILSHQDHLSNQKRSPLMRLANCRSFDMIVTRLAWIAHRLVSSNKDTK